MSGEVFVDTNVLVYAFDDSEKTKRTVAKRIVLDATTGKIKGVVSNQILGELFSVLTQKISVPVYPSDAHTIVAGIIDSANWKKVNYTEKTVRKTTEKSSLEGLPFWNALIAETMLENKVYTILTENTKHFQSEHIKAINPFRQSDRNRDITEFFGVLKDSDWKGKEKRMVEFRKSFEERLKPRNRPQEPF